MSFADLIGFLAAQPVLTLTVVTILVASLGWMIQHSSPRAGRVLRLTGYTGMVAALLLTIISAAFHATRSDVRSSMARDATVQIEGGETVVPLESDGHYWANVQIDATEQDFLIDTGATYTSISAQTAAAAGITPDPKRMPVRLDTANGTIEARFGTAKRLRFGSIEAANLAVVINPEESGETNVIGMNLLSELASWRVDKGKLHLVPAAQD